jgi:hypothetical protein
LDAKPPGDGVFNSNPAREIFGKIVVRLRDRKKDEGTTTAETLWRKFVKIGKELSFRASGFCEARTPGEPRTITKPA